MAVGLTVGGCFASKIITMLINMLIEYAKTQKKIQLGLKDELSRLEKALPKIQAVVNAVDQGLIKEENPPLEKWLWQLRDAADQADDVMDEMEYNFVKEKLETGKNKVSKVVSILANFLERAVNKDPFLEKLKAAMKAIDEVATDVGEFYVLVQDLSKNHKKMVKTAISSRETSSVLNVETQVFGREKEKEDIIQKLLNPDCKTEGMNFAVLPIIGAGGVGKTTLAQLVYNDPEVEKYFELRMWVCISNNFDVVLLTKKLYESVFQERADLSNFDSIQRRLQKALQTKRFLVVFDDAWNDNDKLGWDKLIAPLTYGESGSMILLTTRLKAVATLIGTNVMDSVFLEGLNERDTWDLFQGCAFGGEDPNYHKELVEIGRGIVKKLKGSPLAAKSMGGILCTSLNETYWKGILENELWSLKQGQNDIMPALRLTYQYLPSHLKPCFSFCSIFPQDHVFIKDDLIYMWIALGLVPRVISGTKRSEDFGSEYFDDMLNRAIFVRANPTYHHVNYAAYICSNLKGKKKFECYVMHDLIHDLSTFVSQGECFRTNTDKQVPIPSIVRHLYAHVSDPCKLSISGLKNIRTLILQFDESHHHKLDDVVADMLKGMEGLRVLILLAPDLSELPDKVGDLLHLRYLSVSSFNIRAFPKSMSRLFLLETMVCDEFGFRQLEQVDVLGKLINLRHLIAPWSLVEKIAGIGRLTSLQELSFRARKESGFRISELRDMRELQRLSIERAENVGSHEEAIQANLRNKLGLYELCLQWTPTLQIEKADQFDENVFDHLEPHSSLKKLRIKNYMGIRPPFWLRTQTLSKMVDLKIHGCKWECLPCLEELPFLKYVDFKCMFAVKRIIHKCNQPSSVTPFPSLEILSFVFMPTIDQWCLAEQPNSWMQCLRELTVDNCPNLLCLPPLPVTLKKLKLQGLGLFALPDLWEDKSRKSESLVSLVIMEIINCEKLVSLAQGLLEKPERFAALEKLTIWDCVGLKNLPEGGFKKFISLKELYIRNCPNIEGRSVQECSLPYALQILSISSKSDFLGFLPKTLECVHSLISLELYRCGSITSLPPKEVFSRWKTLKKLLIENCPELTSLESLFGLFSMDQLIIRGCPKLVSSIPSPRELSVDETEGMKEEGTVQTLGRPSSTEPPPTNSSSSMEIEDKPLFSADELVIDDPFLLSIEPIRSFSCVRKLTIEDCSKLQSLPKLPPFLQELSLLHCCAELQRSYDNSSADWSKLPQIPKVIIRSGGYNSEEDNCKGYYATNYS